MPIGKNSIKRVAGNGYSAVKTQAPDMDNSTVLQAEPIAEPKEVKAPELVAYEFIEENTKPRAKRTGRPKKCACAQKTEKSEGEPSYVNIGKVLPTYLL